MGCQAAYFEGSLAVILTTEREIDLNKSQVEGDMNTGAGQAEDIDAQHGTELASEVNDNQHIDVARIKQYFAVQEVVVNALVDRDPQVVTAFREVKEMVFELCDLAQEAGFLKDVQEARQELAGEEAEKVLPSIP